MYASIASGAETHKKISNPSIILKYYYEVPGVMLVAHASNEAFIMSLICLSLTEGVDVQAATFMRWTSVVVAPMMLFKQLTNVLQLKYACQDLALMEKSRKRP
eukprot:GHVR01029434.1.p2 GENE.GHVR01029434.1~~GHVR01029434.1.p2  ORF type:complete len:103 (+),score=12.01 GHVR01029434.1:356-664(+)